MAFPEVGGAMGAPPPADDGDQPPPEPSGGGFGVGAAMAFPEIGGVNPAGVGAPPDDGGGEVFADPFEVAPAMELEPVEPFEQADGDEPPGFLARPL